MVTCHAIDYGDDTVCNWVDVTVHTVVFQLRITPRRTMIAARLASLSLACMFLAQLQSALGASKLIGNQSYFDIDHVTSRIVKTLN